MTVLEAIKQDIQKHYHDSKLSIEQIEQRKFFINCSETIRYAVSEEIYTTHNPGLSSLSRANPPLIPNIEHMYLPGIGYITFEIDSERTGYELRLNLKT